MVKIVLRKQKKEQIDKIPLSIDIIRSQIRDMTTDILNRLMEELKK